MDVASLSIRSAPARRAAVGLASQFHLACANEGILIGPGGFLSVSKVHDAAAISYAITGLWGANS
jgi:hypothetical protein